MPLEQIPEPWNSFLSDIDAAVLTKIELHCLGGFVVSLVYGMSRTTADVDIVTVIPNGERDRLLSLAGKGSLLHRQYGVYLDIVTVATIPEDYSERITEIVPGTFVHLRLFALDPYDVALAKLERNIQRDRDDVKHLARTVPFDIRVLQDRYEKELRPYLGNPTREDLTLKLWIEVIEEENSRFDR